MTLCTVSNVGVMRCALSVAVVLFIVFGLLRLVLCIAAIVHQESVQTIERINSCRPRCDELLSVNLVCCQAKGNRLLVQRHHLHQHQPLR
jgi:hypothetical protein